MFQPCSGASWDTPQTSLGIRRLTLRHQPSASRAGIAPDLIGGGFRLSAIPLRWRGLDRPGAPLHRLRQLFQHHLKLDEERQGSLSA